VNKNRNRTAALLAAAVAAMLMLSLVVVVLNQSNELSTAPRPTTVPTPGDDPAAVTVNGEDIGINMWVETVLVDQVMSNLAGISAPTAEETLERLINDALVIQAAPQEPPDSAQVNDYIVALQAGWEVNDAQVTAALQDAGLERQSLLPLPPPPMTPKLIFSLADLLLAQAG
jgi:membrane-bound lytic murein transglycosylase B